MEFKIDDRPVAEAFESEPIWADIDRIRAVALVPYDRRPEPPLGVLRHPLFLPWQRQIEQTAALQGMVRFQGPAADDELVSRGGGEVAFMSTEQAPRCGNCEGELTVVFQMLPDFLEPWLALDRALTALYCFDCHPDGSDARDRERGKYDGSLACRITLEEPNHPVRFAENDEGARKLGRIFAWDFPDVSFSDLLDTGHAASAFLGDWITNPRVDFTDEYMAMVAARDGYRSQFTEGEVEKTPPHEWRTTIGGYPSWDQEDVTPACSECGEAMQLLTDYNGNQFLDGALHVFTCRRTEACRREFPIDFVAEF